MASDRDALSLSHGATVTSFASHEERKWSSGPKVIIVLSELNSARHEISNAHKYENIKKFSFFQGQISLECYFFVLIML